MRRASRPQGVVAAAALAAVLAAGGGYWAWQGGEARSRNAELLGHLEAGREALARNALTAPTDDNALAHFSRVLALQPDHAGAGDGIRAVGAALLAQAREALREGRVAEAEALVAEAARIAPAQAELEALRGALVVARDPAAPAPAPVAAVAATAAAEPRAVRQVSTRVAVAEPDALARLRIGGMLGSARQALEDGDSVTALQRYEQVLKIDPANREALDGLRQARAR